MFFRANSSSTFISRMCNLFAFHHQFWIDTWRSKFEQQTNSILSACATHGQNHKDPVTIDLDDPRHAQYMHNTRKKHGRNIRRKD